MYFFKISLLKNEIFITLRAASSERENLFAAEKVLKLHILSLTLRLLMSYIYGAPILDVSRSHTTTQHSR
jgi:hypothetical protein